jgi:hypothetical protein
MQSSLPAEPIDRNIKAVDIVDSAEIAKIVAIRVGGPISGACAGRSRAASARLAGMGVMFSMTGTIGARPAIATHRNVTFLGPYDNPSGSFHLRACPSEPMSIGGGPDLGNANAHRATLLSRIRDSNHAQPAWVAGGDLSDAQRAAKG